MVGWESHLFSASAHGSIIAGRLLIHEGNSLPIPVLLLVFWAQVAERFQVLLLSIKLGLRCSDLSLLDARTL